MHAGLKGYDSDYSKAAEVERALGVPVLRHREKKPAGGCEELLQQFGCAAHEIVAVGDRVLTDVVFGNTHGMLTVQVQIRFAPVIFLRFACPQPSPHACGPCVVRAGLSRHACSPCAAMRDWGGERGPRCRR